MKIVFVYNANATTADTVKDFAARMFAPKSYPCNLCQVTYGPLAMKTPWKAFLDTLPQQKIFLHKDEFRRQYSRYANTPLPAIFMEFSGGLKTLVSAGEINRLKNWVELKDLIASKLTHVAA